MRFLVVSLSLVAAVTLCAAQDFDASCFSYYLENTEFFATCRTDSGSDQSTSIDLNNCVVNRSGALECVSSSGGYSASCEDCSLSGTDLDCTCGNGSGGTDSASVNLNNCLTNSNGVLVCA
ncbi:Cyanovirin-N [Pisolithus orientalis]|uniref:Cyanovirin-N n=1 Tax=Pisolithus orientalis TaxID=936130 RepID=UPI002224CD24|nr:Cyanovirin-N [Pisolithus orientalis]KAI6006276.1 Cyanovirin-N [Pisolithus orientalis]